MKLYKKVIRRLIKKKITISVVESCTGGLLSSHLTKVPGISEIFNLGLVTYSNFSKKKLLKINSKFLKKNGAVSKKTAKIMAENLKKITKSMLCISITGIAGPTGEEKNKPIGIVYICYKFKNKTYIKEEKFKGTRIQIQKLTIKSIFTYLERLII